MSHKAYGTCVYVVQSGEDSLVVSKARVAPIKPLTMPKMELMAAVLAHCLVQSFCEAYQCELSFDCVMMWLDSQIVLLWWQNKGNQPAYN